MTSYYVASRASFPERSKMWRSFRDKGVDIISTWIDEAGEGETKDFSELWTRISNEIELCDELVFYAQQGDLPVKGALIEVGMALAFNKKISIVLDGIDLNEKTLSPLGTWAFHPNISFKSSLEEIFGIYDITLLELPSFTKEENEINARGSIIIDNPIRMNPVRVNINNNYCFLGKIMKNIIIQYKDNTFNFLNAIIVRKDSGYYLESDMVEYKRHNLNVPQEISDTYSINFKNWTIE